MTSTKLKGQKKELLCAHDLEADGYRVVFKSCTVKRGPMFVGLDFADLFDVVAVKGTTWKFVSCKHHGSGAIYEDIPLIEKFVAEHGNKAYQSFEMWIWNKACYRGRGKYKKWEQAHWEKRYFPCW